LIDSTTSPNVKTAKGEGVGVHSLIRNISRIERRAEVPRWGLRILTSKSIIQTNMHKPNNKLVNA